MIYPTMDLFVLERDMPHMYMGGKAHEGFLFAGVYSSAEKAREVLISAGFVTAELQAQFRVRKVACDDDLFKCCEA